MSYQILEASIPTDLAALARVNCSARQDEPLWRLLMRNVSAEDELEFTVRNFRDRAVVDDMLYFKAVERESGEIVGFITCKIAGHEYTEKEREMLRRPEWRPEGLYTEMLDDWRLNALAIDASEEYDYRKHYRVCMLMVDPAHQRKGLGTRLAKRTTAIADENGKIMFVGAQDTSKKLFGECGFEVFKKGEYGFERWGGGKGEMMAFYAMRRRGNGGDDDDDGDDDGDKEALDDPHGL